MDRYAKPWSQQTNYEFDGGNNQEDEDFLEWATMIDGIIKFANLQNVNQGTHKAESQWEYTYGKVAILSKSFLENGTIDQLKLIFDHVIDGLANTKYKGNQKPGDDERPSVLWERFARHYFHFIYYTEMNRRIELPAGPGDNGVDVRIDIGNRCILVQVKRGTFFSKGKGPRIVRELHGSMGLYRNVECGILFTNESSHDVWKTAVCDHIKAYRENNVNIQIICIENIKAEIQNCENVEILREFVTAVLSGEILKK